MKKSTPKNQKDRQGDKKEPPKRNSTKNENKRLTHVYMHDKYLEKMDNIPISNALTTLYLHDNLIAKIENLEGAYNLTHLYLQKNNIKKIENLNHLFNLKKLYLGHNEITVVENLDKLQFLEELHIEKQDIAKSDSLCFDPRTMYNIGKSLQILNISHNNITDLQGIEPLKFLKYLNASYNKLETTDAIYKTIKNMYYLCEAEFVGNPVTKVHRYREDIIGNTQRLACLDGKNINETTRCFIKRFDFERTNSSSRQNISIGDNISEIKSYAPALQKAVSVSIMKSLQKDSFDSSGDTVSYIPWKALPSASAEAIKNVPPILRKQKKKSSIPPVLSPRLLNIHPRK